jgi:hypothetical protein
MRGLLGGLVAPPGLMELKPREDAGLVEVQARAPSTRARALCLRDAGMVGQRRFGVAAPRTVVTRAGSPEAHAGRTEPSEKTGSARDARPLVLGSVVFNGGPHAALRLERAGKPARALPSRSRPWARQPVRVARARQAARGGSVASPSRASVARINREGRSRPSRKAWHWISKSDRFRAGNTNCEARSHHPDPRGVARRIGCLTHE